MDDNGARRLRVLVSAYAGGPGDESEANAGWEFAAAAARDHDVWFVTRDRFRPAVDAALAADDELAAHLRVHYLELSPRLLRWKKKPRDVYWYYALWQRELGRWAAERHGELPFDVLHHATFASDWLPCGLRALAADVPLVWGPVGGTTYLPWSMRTWFDRRDLVKELVRGVATRLVRRVVADPVARRASIVVAQNADVARRFAFARRVVVEANAALDPAEPRTSTATRHPRRAVFVGRLIGWKGPRIAVEVMARPAARDWHLDVYGTGPERAAVEALITERGLGDRVRLMGQRPRAEILAAYRDADALLFPSLHDSAGWAVAEASAAGCRVVCLDLGGPPLLAAENGTAVPAGRGAVDGLARALGDLPEGAGVPSSRWLASRLPDLVGSWYADAVASR